MNRTVWFASVLLFSLFLNSVSGFGQDRQQLPIHSRAAQYHLGDKDQILMSVNIWGYVAKPGQYVVPRNTDLISLISFAGGPKEGANLSRVRIVRGGELATGQADPYSVNGKPGKSSAGDARVTILNVDVKHNLSSGAVGAIPVLKGGDTVLVPQTFGSRFKNAVGISSLVGVIATAASVVLIFRY